MIFRFMTGGHCRIKEARGALRVHILWEWKTSRFQRQLNSLQAI